MENIDAKYLIGIIGAGTMGTEIAYMAITSGFNVLVFDINDEAVTVLRENIQRLLKLDDLDDSLSGEDIEKELLKISSAVSIESFKNCSIIFEAVDENKRIKEEVIALLEEEISADTIIASNTSTLSITELAANSKYPEQIIGCHFLNPFFESKIVEITKGGFASNETVEKTQKLISDWSCKPLHTEDSPGFVFNRIFINYILEALSILEENTTDAATIDNVLKSMGNVELGPFELLDLIGIDHVQELNRHIFESEFYNQLFTPSLLIQKKINAHHLGRKSGKGFYDYDTGFVISEPNENRELAKSIYNRIQITIINEAFNCVGKNLISEEDFDLIITDGLKFSKGIFSNINTAEKEKIKQLLSEYHSKYYHKRYLPSIYL